jgi:hypothetical protein
MLCLYTGDLLRLVMMMVNSGLNVVDVSPLGSDDGDVVQSFYFSEMIVEI